MITGGTVCFEDGVKKAEEYSPPRKAKVELTFDVADGADPEQVLDYVQKVAMSKVYEMLSTPGEVARPAAPAPAAKPAKAPRRDKTIAEVAEENNAAVVRSSAVIAQNDKEKLAAQAGLVQQAAPASAPSDPAGMDDFTVQPAAADPAAMSDDLTTVAAEPVSDADLNKAVQTKNAEIANPVAIRAVIASFNPDPAKAFTLAEIPQTQRRTFLEKIKALKKAA